MGPTFSGAAELKIAQNRVMPPSTTSSKTMSATSSPDCGRASGVFSIFTASDDLPLATFSGSGKPVSGAVGIGIVVVVVAGGRCRLVATLSLPLHAASARTTTPVIASTRVRRVVDRITSTPGRGSAHRAAGEYRTL